MHARTTLGDIPDAIALAFLIKQYMASALCLRWPPLLRDEAATCSGGRQHEHSEASA